MLLFKNKYSLDKKIDNYFLKKILEKKKDLVLNLEIIIENLNDYFKIKNINNNRTIKNQYKFISLFDLNFKIYIQFLKDFFSFDFFLFFNLKHLNSIFSNNRLNFFICYFKNNINFFGNLTNFNFYNVLSNYNIIKSKINFNILKIFSMFSFYKGLSNKKFKISEFIYFFYSFKFFFRLIFDFSLKDKNVKKFLSLFKKLKKKKRNKYRKNLKFFRFNNIFLYFLKYKKYNKNNFVIFKKIKENIIKKNYKKLRLFKKIFYYGDYSQKLNKFKNNKSILNILKRK
jgi:hypothetical protein